METFVQEYYKDNAKKLYEMVDKILRKYGGITDHDEFYVLATDVFLSTLKNYDNDKSSFSGFLYSNLSRKIITAIRDKNRTKRSNTKRTVDKDGKIIYEFMPDVSLDSPLKDEESEGTTTLKSIIADDFNVYEKVFGEDRGIKFDKYIDALPKKAKTIAELIGEGYRPLEIKQILHITEKQYEEAMFCIKSSEYISILY